MAHARRTRASFLRAASEGLRGSMANLMMARETGVARQLDDSYMEEIARLLDEISAEVEFSENGRAKFPGLRAYMAATGKFTNEFDQLRRADEIRDKHTKTMEEVRLRVWAHKMSPYLLCGRLVEGESIQ